MKIKLKKLAHVKEATIDDESDLTVIVGDNSTGKTLILETYTFIKRYFHKELENIYEDMINELEALVQLETEMSLTDMAHKFSNLNMPSLEDKYKIEIMKTQIRFNSSDVERLNTILMDRITDKYEHVIERVEKEILFNDSSNFSFELMDLPKLNNFFEKKYELHIGLLPVSRLGLSLLGENIQINRTMPFENNVLNSNELRETNEKYGNDFKEYDLSYIFFNIKKLFLEAAFNDYFGFSNILYLPSERNLIMDNALLAAAEMDQNLKQRYSERLFTSAYFKFKHFIERFPSIISPIAKNTRDLFEGSLEFDNKGELISITRDDGIQIKRELFSTMQNRLIPYLLVDNPLEGYKTIIIEEPEAHLSLKSQKKMLRYMIRLTSEKRLVITTHSDVFFSFLNNMLLENPAITVNVYELRSNDSNEQYLEKINRSAYGYQIDMFTNLLEELYEDTLRIQKENREKET